MINALPLPLECHEAIFLNLMESFPVIDSVLAEHLKIFIPKFALHVSITPSHARNLQKMLKVTTAPLEVNRLPRTDLIRMVFEAASLRVVYEFLLCENLFWSDINTLKEVYGTYPEFHDLPVVELQKLLKFRNMMVVALQLMPAKLEHLLDLCVSILNPTRR